MSEWKQRAAKRRDERNTKVSDEPVQSLTPKKKKDTKKWCKGKEGIEHKLECKLYDETKHSSAWGDHSSRRILICTTCGKEFGTYSPTDWWMTEKPEWVDK